MKTLLFAICLFAVVGCSKDEITPEPVNKNAFLIGQIYTGDYSVKSTYGYRFESETEATIIFVAVGRRMTMGSVVKYSGTYPNLIIGGEIATFLDKNTFKIKAVTLKKW